MSQENFYDTLQALSTEKKTGRLVICSIEDSLTHFGNLELKDGEIVRASYLNKTGNDAVSAMLELNITDMRFMGATVADNGNPDKPTVATCLQQLYAKVQQLQVEQQTKQVLSSDLQEGVLPFLEKLYGAEATS